MIKTYEGAMKFFNKNRKGNIQDIRKIIEPEILMGLQQTYLPTNPYDGIYKFTKAGVWNYKTLYGGKFNFFEKIECFFGNLGNLIIESFP